MVSCWQCAKTDSLGEVELVVVAMLEERCVQKPSLESRVEREHVFGPDLLVMMGVAGGRDMAEGSEEEERDAAYESADEEEGKDIADSGWVEPVCPWIGPCEAVRESENMCNVGIS